MVFDLLAEIVTFTRGVNTTLERIEKKLMSLQDDVTKLTTMVQQFDAATTAIGAKLTALGQQITDLQGQIADPTVVAALDNVVASLQSEADQLTAMSATNPPTP